MKYAKTLENLVPVGKNGMTTLEETESACRKEQAISARMTTGHTSDARTRAMEVIEEIVVTTEACKASTAALVSSGKQLSEQAERTKIAVQTASDRIGAASKRALDLVDQDRLERAANHAERLVAALSHLAEIAKDGRLHSIVNALK